MDMQMEVDEPVDQLYRISYKVYVADVKTIMLRAAQKAGELNVRGYMTYTQCGYATSGELEGTHEALECMMSWMETESLQGGEGIQFGPFEVLLRPGYDEFFCCC